eukprot:989856-Pelagomonas_calceolata.AAC.2
MMHGWTECLGCGDDVMYTCAYSHPLVNAACLPDPVKLTFAAGIPKFYRWLSERYPLVNKTIASSEGPPVVDALYLDMNGIIHNCTHANQQEIKLTKEEMIVRMFDYISKLVQIIKPQKLLFMAIDGEAEVLISGCHIIRNILAWTPLVLGPSAFNLRLLIPHGRFYRKKFYAQDSVG